MLNSKRNWYGSSVRLAVIVLGCGAFLSACSGVGVKKSNKDDKSVGSGYPVQLPMKLGPMADYGATPWYTDAITIGSSPVRLALDSGANFNWATSDQCTTTACNAHEKVDTANMTWVDPTQQQISFGPWGTMTVELGRVIYTLPETFGVPVQPIENVFLAFDYTGPKFQYLNWGGGVGLPSNSQYVKKSVNGSQSGFLPRDLYSGGSLGMPEFAMITDRDSGTGTTYFGGNDDGFNQATEVRLAALPTSFNYLWGTPLYDVAIGSTSLGNLGNGVFIVDSGSSRFKGDEDHILPILNQFLTYKDTSENPIFQKYYEEGEWTGLQYISGGPNNYVGILQNMTIKIGQSCNGTLGCKRRCKTSPLRR